MAKVLFVSFKKYASILEGGGIANQRLVDMAENMFGKSNVDVIYIHDENKRRSVFNLIQSALLFPFGYFNGLTPSAIDDIVRKASGYDFVFITTSLFGIIAKRLKESGYRGRVMVHFHNVESQYYEARVSKLMPLRGIIIGCAFKNDGYSIRYADASVALNQRDAQMLEKMYGKKPSYILPVTMADKCSSMTLDAGHLTSARPRCVFIGSNFPANSEGLLWFVRNVLPHVDIDFKVVGKDMAKLKAERPELKDVEVVSDAPDLAPHFLAADFLVLPIFSGSGMKVKTCEALMYGKNIIGSDESFEGYDIDVDKVGARCNTAQEYIDAIKLFSRNPIPRYNSYSREAFLSLYSNESAQRKYAKLFHHPTNM